MLNLCILCSSSSECSVVSLHRWFSMQHKHHQNWHKLSNNIKKSLACLRDETKENWNSFFLTFCKNFLVAAEQNWQSSFFPPAVVKIVLYATQPVGTFYLNKSFDCLTDCLSNSLNFYTDNLKQEAKGEKKDSVHSCWSWANKALSKRRKALKPYWAQCTTVYNMFFHSFIYLFF